MLEEDHEGAKQYDMHIEIDRLDVINRLFYSDHIELTALWLRIFALGMPRQVWFEVHLHAGILQVCIYSYIAQGACNMA